MRPRNFEKDIQRIFAVNTHVRSVQVMLSRGDFYGGWPRDLGTDWEPILRLIKARGGRDTIKVVCD